MTRIVVSVIKSAVFILGIVLASCFIGRGANSRMKHVVGVQQRFIARRDRKNSALYPDLGYRLSSRKEHTCSRNHRSTTSSSVSSS